MKLFSAKTRKGCKLRKTGNIELNFSIDIKSILKSGINRCNEEINQAPALIWQKHYKRQQNMKAGG